MLGKCHTPHTQQAHERYLMSKSLISRLAGREEKMAQQLLLVGLALSSIWENARARDGQTEVAGDKGQWGFVLQGMRPAVGQAAEWWQGAVLIKDKIYFCRRCTGTWAQPAHGVDPRSAFLSLMRWGPTLFTWIDQVREHNLLEIGYCYSWNLEMG
jgi:hypothetical protein